MFNAVISPDFAVFDIVNFLDFAVFDIVAFHDFGILDIVISHDFAGFHLHAGDVELRRICKEALRYLTALTPLWLYAAAFPRCPGETLDASGLCHPLALPLVLALLLPSPGDSPAPDRVARSEARSAAHSARPPFPSVFSLFWVSCSGRPSARAERARLGLS